MNKLFKVIYNHHTQSFQAVCEYGKSHTTTSSTSKPNKTSSFKAKILSVFVGGLMSSVAIASPTNGVVTAGQAVINQNELITNINQSSQNAAINWQSFNVGKNETVNFHQPNAQSVTLNRVIGNERSVIDGAMNANGKVFISNANGMLIGKNAQINVGSLVATTAKISDDDFMKGNYRFDNAQGSIENLGHISVPQGGVVALVAPIVKNGGTITAHEGKVLLASADSFSITLPQDGFAYTLDKGTLQGLVDNGGAILADAGRVVLTAKGVDTVKKSLIKHSGNIEANTVQNKNGVIELLGDLDNSALNVSGSLKAEGKGDDKGGFIETSSAQLNFDDNAVISTKSETGQTGTWLIDPKDFTVAPSGGDITGAKVSEGLQSNNVTLKSRDGAKEGNGDVIVNDEISWDKNTLTLNAENDIHINKTMNGTGSAKLALEYGGISADVKLNNKSKINLPEGKNLSVQKGSSEKYELLVVHSLPKGQDFLDKDIAIGKDIDMLGINRSNGWYFPKNHNSYYGSLWGLGHNIDNLKITGVNEVGLVPKLNGGVVRDLNLNNINITGNENVGGIIGRAYSHGTPTKIQNIDISGSISGGKYIGGIVGNAELRGWGGGVNGIDGNIDVKKINTSLIIKGNDDVGGVIGYSTLQGVGAGGAVLNISKINTNNSHTSGNENIGGIIGSTYVATGNEGTARLEIYETAVNGSISSKNNNTGGFIGYSSTSSGIYGWSDIFLRDSYSNAHIQGKNNVGGLMGKIKTSGFSEVERVYLTSQVKGGSNTNIDVGSTELVKSSNFEIKFKDSFFDKTKIPQSDKNGLKGKTTKEMQQKSTFTNWDFNTVWYMNEGSMPKLRAFATPLAVTPSTPTLNAPTDKAQAGVKAPDLSKTYDGKAVNTVDDLKKLNGWKDNFDADGLTTGDSVESIFKAGTLTIDETRGDWKGAKDVKKGGYELYPTGTLKDEYQQKYIIEWNKGILTINPAKLTITAMNNIKPEGSNNPDVSRIGVAVKGLVDGESIGDVNLSYSDNKLSQGDISIIQVGEPVFKNGKASNYEITKNHGKLLTVQKEYDLKNITDKKPEDVAKIRDLLNPIEDEILLAHAVYGSDSAKKGDADRWYEIWEVKDNATGVTTKELHKLGFDNEPKDSTKTYAKIYELIKDQSVDYSDGVRYQITIKKDWAIDDTKIVTQAEYDELLKTTPKDNITINKTFRDGLYSATEPNGLNVGVYQKVGTDKKFIVFRGTDTGQAVTLNDSDGHTNIVQLLGEPPKQYIYSKELVQNLINKNPHNSITIIGHSLGGGLATYASIHQNKKIPTITFNQSQIHYKNLPNIYVDMWDDYFNTRNNKETIYDDYRISIDTRQFVLSKTKNDFSNIKSYIFDKDILQKTQYHNNIIYPSGRININFMSTNKDVEDHVMPHIIKTQQLADITAKNNEILANCQSSDCQILRQNRWTLPATNLKKIDNKRVDKISKLINEQNQVHQQISELEKQGKNSERKQRDLDKINQKLEKATQAEVTSSGITVIRDNDTFSVKKNNGWQFKKGDIINTGNKKAKIYFPDGSWVELDKNTSIEITIEYNPNIQLDKPIASYISLLKGKILKEGTKK